MVVALQNQAGKQQNASQMKSTRLLWLGDRQVGKSAAIVRYTTGRFIQEYSSAANDWLYYKMPPATAPAPAPSRKDSLIELLEQRDVQFNNSGNFFSNSNSNLNSISAERQSLSSRVALDQLQDQELHEKQQMLERLKWADAYIVVYSISDIQSFQKAIKYMNLIANRINSSSNNSSNQRRPVLLLGNKRDLEASAARQVQAADGRHLAIRHQSMFGEVSVAQTGRQLDQILAAFIDQIETPPVGSASNNYERLITSCTQHAAAGQPRKSSSPLIGLWPARRSSSEQHSQLHYSVPVARAILAKSQPVSSSCVVQSCRVLVSSDTSEQTPSATTRLASMNSLPPDSHVGHLPTAAAAAAAAGVATKGGRYENFKSSFKKASMAIVGSRALSGAAKSTLQESAEARPGEATATATTVASGDRSSLKRRSLRQRNLTSQPSSSSSSSQISMASQPANNSSSSSWIRNHIRLSRGGRGSGITTQPSTATTTSTSKSPTSSSDPKLDASLMSGGVGGGGGGGGDTLGERIKRPLFKYKNRHKTVALEAVTSGQQLSLLDKQQQIRKPSLASQSSLLFGGSSSLSSASTGAALNEEQQSGGSGYNTARQSSARSSCSLSSPSDATTYHSSSLTMMLNSYDSPTPPIHEQKLPSTAPADRIPSSVGSASVCSSSSCCSQSNQSSSSRASIDLPLMSGQPPLRQQQPHSYSRSTTLSRGSTSAGDDEEHACLPPSGSSKPPQAQPITCYATIQRVGAQVATISEVKPNNRKPTELTASPAAATSLFGGTPAMATTTPSKKRYQLVKSVQNTLTNLTRSSNVNNGQLGVPAKRSICTGLFKSSTTTNGAVGPTNQRQPSMPVVELNLAKTEQVQPKTLIVGYCK